MQVRERTDHLQNKCSTRRIRCPYLCGALLIARHAEMHCSKTCPAQPTLCSWCTQSVPVCSATSTCRTSYTCDGMQAHTLRKHKERDCPRKKVMCPQKCGEEVLVADVRKHAAETCSKRLEFCLLSCGLKLRLCDMEAHTSRDCSLRMTECALCTTTLLAKFLLVHMKLECEERLITCAVVRAIVSAVCSSLTRALGLMMSSALNQYQQRS
jgi:hypothetical protein